MAEQLQNKKIQIPSISQAKMDIENAASQAVKVISAAAGEAAKVVAEAAAVSVKVLSIKNADDHDLLIELKTRMESLRNDIKDLKDNTSTKIDDHEKRIFDLETSKGRQSTFITIGVSILVVLISFIVFHLTGVKI